jgi:hypothetical protein
MQNGTEIRALIEDTRASLGELTALDYLRQAIPSPLDAAIDQIIDRYMGIHSQVRTHFAGGLQQSQRSLFGIYGHRAATRAVRQEDGLLLRRGLLGAVIANHVVPVHRRLEVALAVYYHCARRLDLSPADLFEEAATFAGTDLAEQLRRFGHRTDVSLPSFGWQEVKTPHGVEYKFSWI